ncbi:hypothetical protein [Pseudomonas sp. Z3-8]|uniref:hypothetical protein n=1 Tax=Pseudomonas sp. Z3-8 TaxID=2817412 RepID=UPI003DA82B61
MNPVNGYVLSSALDVLVKSPLIHADDAALVSAATAVWYSNLDLTSTTQAFLGRHTEEIEIRRAGYLLERFTRFSCVTDARASDVFKALEVFWLSTPKQAVTSKSQVALRKRRDELALSWGLSEGLGLKIQTLLPYQTRHYEAQQRATIL